MSTAFDAPSISPAFRCQFSESRRSMNLGSEAEAQGDLFDSQKAHLDDFRNRSYGATTS